MPFEPGNTLGAKAGLWRATLERAIKQEDGKRLREAAEQLLTQAAIGESWAIRELADRLDGKAHQAVDIAATGDITVKLVHFGAGGGTDPPV